jgi:hypothetical protein
VSHHRTLLSMAAGSVLWYPVPQNFVPCTTTRRDFSNSDLVFCSVHSTRTGQDPQPRSTWSRTLAPLYSGRHASLPRILSVTASGYFRWIMRMLIGHRLGDHIAQSSEASFCPLIDLRFHEDPRRFGETRCRLTEVIPETRPDAGDQNSLTTAKHPSPFSRRARR